MYNIVEKYIIISFTPERGRGGSLVLNILFCQFFLLYYACYIHLNLSLEPLYLFKKPHPKHT
jgi:hypothetical protein